MRSFYLFLVLLVAASLHMIAQPKVLLINAHPDDESGCAATVYKITHHLKGVVDACLVTNGEAGFKYSTLAEEWYGYELTEEKIGREHLPRIRKQEMLEAGKIIGLRNIFFLDHIDHKYTTNEKEVLDSVWDANVVTAQIKSILERGKYDYVFCLLPTVETHGGHKGASLLALQAVASMKQNKPIVLGVGMRPRNDTLPAYTGLAGYPLSAVDSTTQIFSFDKTTKFGFNNRLSYKIIVNWLIAEHKSQGAMQLAMNEGDAEYFYYFTLNGEAGKQKTATLFESLKTNPYKKKSY